MNIPYVGQTLLVSNISYILTKVKFLPSPFLVNKAVPISVSLAFGPHSYASTVNATVRGSSHLVALCVSLPRFFP